MTKRLGSNFFIAGLLLMPAFVQAQRLPVNYSVVTYRKIAPEKVDAFLAYQKTMAKKVAEAWIANGTWKSWSLMKLTTPYAAGSDYNYIVVASLDHFPELDMPLADVDAMIKKAGFDPAEYRKKGQEFGPSVHQQIIRGFLRVGKSNVGDFFRVDYHQVAPEHMAEMMDLEENVYAPMFKSLLDANDGFNGWWLSLPVHPNANEIAYNFSTVQVFKDSARLGQGAVTSEDLFKKMYPNRPWLQTMERVRAADKIVKMRVYHVLDSAGTPVMPK